MRAFSAFHGVEKSTFEDWLKIFGSGGEDAFDRFRHSKRGRPEILDEEGKQRVKEKLLQLGMENKHVKMSKLKSIIGEEAELEANARGKTLLGRDVSKSTIFHIAKDIGVKNRQAQAKTHARIVAESDPRNVITMGVMMDVFCKSLGPEYIFNWDATQYEVNPKGNLRVLVVDDDAEDSPVTVESEGGLSYFIKHFFIFIMLMVQLRHQFTFLHTTPWMPRV